MLSIIIPAYKDPFLPKTIESLIKNAAGEIEIIPVIDGYTPEVPIKKQRAVSPLVLAKNLGMRGAFNEGLKKARGEFIMKCDSHCAFGPDFDIILTQECEKNWLIIPRRYSLDEAKWERNNKRPFRDYHFLSYPTRTRAYGTCLSNQNWPERTRQRLSPEYDIDETMTFEGSCWVANKEYFLKRIGSLDDRPDTYGPFADEPQEIGLKYWLGGGAVKINKKTWYAHLTKRSRHYKSGLFDRSYKINKAAVSGHTWSANHWFGNKEPGMKYPLSWLIEKFWPVPTWPEDKSLWSPI